MSQQSLYYRFLSVPRIDLARAAAFAQIDYDRQFVLVGESGEPLAAIAGYCRGEKDPERAEVAFSVPDAMQGRGIGTRMLERLAEIGRERGVRVFEAYVLGENRKMMDVFLESGFKVTQQLDSGVYHVTLSIEPTLEYETRAAGRSQKAAAASMRPFFEPRVVAVVGANRERGRIGSEILHNLHASGFTGTLAPVHPDGGVIDGLQAYTTVRDIPHQVDLAVVVVAAVHVPAVVDDCIAKGVKALVVISAGFGETGPEGKRARSSRRRQDPRRGDPHDRPELHGDHQHRPAFALNATFSPVYPPGGPRGAFRRRAVRSASRFWTTSSGSNLGISTFASIGNKADVSGNDLIQYWADDPRTDVILLYLESFGNPRKFGADCASRRPAEADRRREGRTVVGRRACRVVAHRGAGHERRPRRHVAPSGWRDPYPHARRALRRRLAARDPARPSRPAGRDRDERGRPRHPRR